jgi:hypothetical protein
MQVQQHLACVLPMYATLGHLQQFEAVSEIAIGMANEKCIFIRCEKALLPGHGTFDDLQFQTAHSQDRCIFERFVDYYVHNIWRIDKHPQSKSSAAWRFWETRRFARSTTCIRLPGSPWCQLQSIRILVRASSWKWSMVCGPARFAWARERCMFIERQRRGHLQNQARESR